MSAETVVRWDGVGTFGPVRRGAAPRRLGERPGVRPATTELHRGDAMKAAERADKQGKQGKHLLPHDVIDLRLAPVALHVDSRLQEMAALDPAALQVHIAMDTDRDGATPAQRGRDVVGSVCRLIDLGGWKPSWDDRGVRLTHGTHTLVLGVPANVRTYVEEGPVRR